MNTKVSTKKVEPKFEAGQLFMSGESALGSVYMAVDVEGIEHILSALECNKELRMCVCLSGGGGSLHTFQPSLHVKVTQTNALEVVRK